MRNEAAGYVLDTDVFSDLRRGKPSIIKRMRQVTGHPFFITVVTKIEQLEGRFQQLRTAQSAEQLLKAYEALIETENTLSQIPILPVDEAAAYHFQNLLHKKLGKMRRHDLLIAAIVLNRNYTLITRNVKDFRRVPGLKVADWSR